jgi:cell division protein ZapA (FtsZ GTPase activity inhibitor)
MAGAALRGMGKVLAKHLRKAPALGKYAKAGAARRASLRGETLADQARGVIPKVAKAPKKKPIISKFEVGVGTGVTGTLAVQQALKKQKEVKAEGKAKETKAKKALTRALDRHKKSTKEAKEKREKHGKPHA